MKWLRVTMPDKQIAISPAFVMAGLVPAIHVLFLYDEQRTWMPGTNPGMTAEG